ncbi:hypothetical protein [Streptomyces sp. NPDC004285]
MWHLVDEAEAATCEARIEQRQAESQLAAAHVQYDRAVAYLGQAERRRDADGYRLSRALRAVAYEREQAEGYRRTIKHLTDRLLDATGYQGKPLLDPARQTLGIDVKEDV